MKTMDKIVGIIINCMTGKEPEVKNIFNHDAGASVNIKIFHKKIELGTISMVAVKETDYYRLDSFRVRKIARKHGIGRKLLSAMIEEVKKDGGTTLIVYPNTEPYEGEPGIDPQKLYEIYEHLGFQLANKMADISQPNNKMIMTI